MRYCGKNVVVPDRQQMTVLYGACYKHKFIVFNTYVFSTATVVTRTRLYVNIIRTLPVLILAWRFSAVLEFEQFCSVSLSR